MDGIMFNTQWNLIKDWLSDDLIERIKEKTQVSGRNVGSICNSLKFDGEYELCNEFKKQLNERVKSNKPPEIYSTTIFIDNKPLKIRLGGCKETIKTFKKSLKDHRIDLDGSETITRRIEEE